MDGAGSSVLGVDFVIDHLADRLPQRVQVEARVWALGALRLKTVGDLQALVDRKTGG